MRFWTFVIVTVALRQLPGQTDQALVAGAHNVDSARESATPDVAAKIQVVAALQYMDKWRLDRSGSRAIANDSVKRALGFPIR
jgi:hypothetical protein